MVDTAKKPNRFLELRMNHLISGDPSTPQEAAEVVQQEQPNRFLEMRKQSQQAAQAPAPQAAPVESQGVVGDTLDTMASTMGTLGANALEAQRRFVGGVAEIPAGIVQAGIDVVDNMWPVEPGEQSRSGKFADQFNALRDATKFSDRAEFNDSMAFDLMEKAGEFIPSFFLPATKTIKGAAAIGGALGATQFNEDPAQADRLMGATTGALAGGVMQGVLSTINFFRPSSFAQRSITAATDKADEAAMLTERTGVPFKVSQITEDLGVEDIENLAKTSLEGARMAKAFESKQVLAAFKHFKKLERSLDPSKTDFGTRLTNVFDATTEKVLKQRSTQANKDFDLARKIVGDLDIIPSNNTTAALADITDKFKGDKSMSIGEVRAFMNKIEKFKGAFEEKPSMNVKDLQQLLESMGRASDGKAGLFSKAPGFDKYSTTKLHKALQQDLAEAAEAGVPGATQLKAARDNYAANSQVIDELKSTTLASLFGTKTMPAPEKVEELFATMHPSQIRASMKLLGDVDPGLHQGLQRFKLARSIGDARKAAAGLPAGEARIDMSTLMKKLDNDPQFKAIFDDSKTRQNVMDGVRALRKLGIGQGAPGTQLGPKMVAAAGSVVSRSPIFLTRAAASTFVPTELAKILFSKEGVASLRTLTRQSAKPGEVAAAAVELQQFLESGK
tara:strand:+ start:35228 stop:37249 length:2022 start_codon:yes stop_codon:yes gene_type:complete